MSRIVDETIVDDWMRINALKFLENVSFNETYIREVNKYRKNKEQIDKNNKLIGLIRSIILRR